MIQTNLRKKEMVLRVKESDVRIMGMDFRLLERLLTKRGLNRRMIGCLRAKIHSTRRKVGLNPRLIHFPFGEIYHLSPAARADHRAIAMDELVMSANYSLMWVDQPPIFTNGIATSADHPLMSRGHLSMHGDQTSIVTHQRLIRGNQRE